MFLEKSSGYPPGMNIFFYLVYIHIRFYILDFEIIVYKTMIKLLYYLLLCGVNSVLSLSEWSEHSVIRKNDLDEWDASGAAVAVYGNYMAIGVDGDDGESNTKQDSGLSIRTHGTVLIGNIIPH